MRDRHLDALRTVEELRALADLAEGEANPLNAPAVALVDGTLLFSVLEERPRDFCAHGFTRISSPSWTACAVPESPSARTPAARGASTWCTCFARCAAARRWCARCAMGRTRALCAGSTTPT